MMNHQVSQEEKSKSPESPYLTLPEVAVLLRKSRSSVQKTWPKWAAWGVHPVRYQGSSKGRLLFDSRDVEKMLKHWSVYHMRRNPCSNLGPLVQKRKSGKTNKKFRTQ